MPDGRLVFESNRSGNFEIYIAELDSGKVVNLSNHPRQDREPAWSGDGMEVAFVSNRDWNDHIYSSG